MERSEPAAPVVRQLDFTVNLNGNANANARSSLILPEHPQAQLQSKLLALAQSQSQQQQQLHASARSQLASPPRGAPRLAHPVYKPVPVLNPKPKPAAALNQPLLKSESPKPREKSSLEQTDGTPKKQKQCNCKNSRCLKLYCECFASGIYCDGCNCINCHNKVEYEADRKESVDAILERNPNAFRPKIASSPHGATDGGVEHNKGCNCKKSGCLKKYCECFQANILCSDKCKCNDCKNFEGSEERKAQFYENPANSVAFIHQVVNAAINGAVGSPRKKSRNQQITFGVTSNKRVTNLLPQFHQETFVSSDVPPLSANLSKPDATKLGRSKTSYRSPLSGVVQLEHVKDLCTLLVEVSAEATKSFSEEKKMINNEPSASEAETSLATSHEDGKDHQNQRNSLELCETRENQHRTPLCELDSCGIQNRRPLSPGTLALMCDEQDTTFITADAPPSTTEPNARTTNKSASTQVLNQLYVEQERLVLTKFRDFLNRLITCGSIEESKIEQESK